MQSSALIRQGLKKKIVLGKKQTIFFFLIMLFSALFLPNTGIKKNKKIYFRPTYPIFVGGKIGNQQLFLLGLVY